MALKLSVNQKVKQRFYEQLMSNTKYQVMAKKITKKNCITQLTKLLKFMAQEKQYRENINYIRKLRAAFYFRLAVKRKKIQVKDKSKFGTLVLVAAVLKE